MSVLEVDCVSKRFGSLIAVRDVSLTVKEGELRAIIGPNGAGKTTFFNLISGFFPPTAGTIAFDGRDITKLSTHERVVRGMARTFQITQLIRRLHRDSNYTIVLIEHDMRVVFHLADRICVLDQGKMLAQGTPQEIAANETVQAAYLGNAA